MVTLGRVTWLVSFILKRLFDLEYQNFYAIDDDGGDSNDYLIAANNKLI